MQKKYSPLSTLGVKVSQMIKACNGALKVLATSNENIPQGPSCHVKKPIKQV